MLPNQITHIIGKTVLPSHEIIFNDKAINFLNDLSNELKNNKKTMYSSELFSLMLWSSKKNLLIHKEKYRNSSFRIGRGILFHICPSNVPLNFFYSFAFGLLSGNGNIIKLPTKKFEETEILLEAIKAIINKKEYKSIKKTNIFIRYEKNKLVNDYFSSFSDGRIIWGSDKTVSEIKESALKTKSIEIVFPDRYSLCIININKLKKLSEKKLKIIIKSFFYDSYTMKQQACNSPHFIFWIGKKDSIIIKKFWTILSEIVNQKNKFQAIDIIDKYNHICNQFIELKKIKNFTNYSNKVYVTDYKDSSIEYIRGLNGIFYQKYANKIIDIKKSINEKCQTVTYFGFEKKNFISIFKKKPFRGIDRIVPIGKSMSINFTWDGFDMIKSLSRIVDIQ
jgi:hypothetical protein